MIISLDTETTGVDFFHGAQPYFVTTCSDKGELLTWGSDWKIDPLTRRVEVPREDVREIEARIEEAEYIVLQNSRFDISALSVIGIERFPWHKVHDTLIASHLLASILPHDLTTLSYQYLGRDISRHEEYLHKCCEAARRMARSLYPEWMIAEKGLPCMPSAKEKVWAYDMWLPKTLAVEEGMPVPKEGCRHSWNNDDECDHCGGHAWYNVMEDYSNIDSEVTLQLWTGYKSWKGMESELHKRGLWEIYLERLKLLPIASKMEKRGITVNKKKLYEQKREYILESERLGTVCTDIARVTYGYDLVLPKSGRNGSLDKFAFEVMELPVLDTSEKTGKPSFDADIKEQYEGMLPSGSHQLLFIESLNKKSRQDTAITYMDGYERYWLDLHDDYKRLHPKLNITGTSTLQWSSSNPNEQNISKQGKNNLRKSFGPNPGRVWYSFDAANIQLRIPAYRVGERELIDVFDRPNDPPYYGSYHLFISDILHPALFKEHGKEFKTVFEDTWYQWVKNGNFCRQFGGQKKKCDATYRVAGAYDMIAERCPKIDAYNRQMIAYADKHGYVETLPNSRVNPRRGYPLMVSRSERGQVVPTIPFCYHVAGTAQDWLNAAMINVDAKLEEWRRKDKFHAYMIMAVHDELVLDLPVEKVEGHNLTRVMILKNEMEKCGDYYGIPTPVNIEQHDDNWGEGIKLN